MKRRHHHTPDDPIIEGRGCLYWIIIGLLVYFFFARCTPTRTAWVPDTYRNVTLHRVTWTDHNRHTLWLVGQGDTLRVVRNNPSMTRPRYTVGTRYHIAWRSQDGELCDSTHRLRFTLKPGWRGTL